MSENRTIEEIRGGRKCMWPINGPSKARRLTWGADQNVISWAYMKMLRESHICKVYDCNPYVEVYQFRDNMYGLFNQNNDGAGDVWMYVTVGPEKAFVVDTACGLGDQRALIDELTGGKELIVVNTHLGPDHSFGNTRYDTVYCHEYEKPAIDKAVCPTMFDYLFDANGNNIWLQFDPKDLPEYREYNLIGVPDGYTWNLGDDYEIELIWTGGHGSGGHAMYLDKKNRLIFAGDDVCSDVSGVGNGARPGVVYGKYCNLETYRDNLIRLCARLDEFDYIFPGHFMVNLESHLFNNFLETINKILEDPNCYDYKKESVGGKGGGTRVRYFKYIPGFSVLAYTMEGVYRPKD